MLRTAIALAFVLVAAISAPAQAARDKLDIRVFTKIGNPGQPEPVAVGPDGRVYVGTNQLGHGDADAPSRIFAFSQSGKLLRQYVLRGQPLNEDHGIQGLAFDRDGLLYVLDRSADPRVVVLNPATGSQRRYASFRDVPPCVPPASGDCSQTKLDNPSGPDYGTFSASGELYVTDIDQALIWKVPRGGGRPQVWFSDPRLESVFGPNGIQFMADGRTLLFANTASNPMAGNPLTGRLYTVPVQANGAAGALAQVWESLPLDGPDGFALARSGNVYIALAGSNQVALLSPQFTELARTPPDPVANQQEEVPLDAPASLAFLGRRVLVTNHSAIRGEPSSWAVLDVFAGEPGLPLFYPRIFKPALRLRAKAASGSCARLRIRVTRHLASKEVAVPGATARAAGASARTNARGEATLALRQNISGPIAVTARKSGFTAATKTVRVRSACANGGGESDSD